MANFMEELAHKNSPEYKQQQQRIQMSTIGERWLENVMYLIRNEIEKHYNDHHFSGYITCYRASGFESYSFVEKMPKTQHSEHYVIPKEPGVFSYIQQELPSRIKQLGINSITIDYPQVRRYRRTTIGPFGTEISLPTNQYFTNVYISLAW